MAAKIARKANKMMDIHALDMGTRRKRVIGMKSTATARSAIISLATITMRFVARTFTVSSFGCLDLLAKPIVLLALNQP